jgi:UDP-3-O-[3-hydroxymyristoyl] N-acetylglucosamine deacetylase
VLYVLLPTFVEFSREAAATAFGPLQLKTYEQTIETPVECSGMGLHSGAKVKMRIVPAPAGSGIVFRRVDLDGFCVEAVSRNVAKVSYATSLMKQGVLISTTEHLLSAFIGCGIDNAVVELDSLEVPVLDGSARPFVEMVAGAGQKQQRRRRVYLRILRPLEVRDGEKFIGVYPGDGYSVRYTIDFPHPLIGFSSFQVDLSDGEYCREIAAARTFGFLADEAALRHMGLIRGVSPENCVVLTQDGVANPPLRFTDEFVRHKVLDLIGDLALLGRRILGRVVADKAGHAMHTALVSRILKDRSLWEETTLDQLPSHHRERPAALAGA